MKKLTEEHRKSLNRAILIMQMQADRQNVPKYKKEFIHDLTHLNDISEHVDNLVTSPMFDGLTETATHLNW